MASNLPFTRGQFVKLKLYQDNKPIYVACKVWDVEEDATEVVDDVGGENRSRLDKVTNYYRLSLDVFQADEALVTAYLAAQDADDASTLPKTQTGAIQITHRDGTRAAYILSEAKFGPFKQSMSGRTDAYMMNLKVRFRYFKPVPSI